MLAQLAMEESADDRRHSFLRSQLERKVGEDGEREREGLATAQARLATTQVRQNCMETLREVERRRGQVEERENQDLAQVSC